MMLALRSTTTTAAAAAQLNASIVKQQIRHLRTRKPPWEPLAKSKQFYVPKRAPVNTKLAAFIRPIENEYKAQMRSLLQLFKTEGKFTDQASLKVQEEKRVIFEQEKLLLKLNDQMNEQILSVQLRHDEQRLAAKRAELEKKYHQKLQEEAAAIALANEKIRVLKQQALKFVDPSRLDEEIERALNERCDYNFAVDYMGRAYRNGKRITNPYKYK